MKQVEWTLVDEAHNIRDDAKIAEEVLAFVAATGARSVVTKPCLPLQQSAVSR
jgi:hypothetical protein